MNGEWLAGGQGTLGEEVWREGDDFRLSGQHSKPEVGLDGILQMIEFEKGEHFPKWKLKIIKIKKT